MERKTMSLQDWGPVDRLQIEQGVSQGRKTRNLQCHGSQGKLGNELQDQMLRALVGKGWGRGLGTKKGLLDFATGSRVKRHFIRMARGEARVQVVKS